MDIHGILLISIGIHIYGMLMLVGFVGINGDLTNKINDDKW